MINLFKSRGHSRWSGYATDLWQEITCRDKLKSLSTQFSKSVCSCIIFGLKGNITAGGKQMIKKNLNMSHIMDVTIHRMDTKDKVRSRINSWNLFYNSIYFDLTISYLIPQIKYTRKIAIFDEIYTEVNLSFSR